ncbi:aldehyde dehydrogenase family protein [Candidatus Microgenomates bacterium]|nr:aldehyde dehydrogenase family protein [Candidatus Microgenomates bacterium]
MSSFFNDIKEERIYKFFSGGKWVKSSSGNLIDVLSPIDNSLVGKLQAVTEDEVDEILEQAKRAQKKWANFHLEDRAAILKKAAELLRTYCDEITEIKVLEIAKTINSAKSSVLRSADIIDYTANQMNIFNAPYDLAGGDFSPKAKNKNAHITREPLGVVLAISPFNYPINLAVTKIAPALLAGNSVVVKGPTQGSICTAMLIEIFNKAGVVPGAISFVSGHGATIGDYLVGSKYIDMINFTGSTDVGKNIAIKAGFKPLLLEMGGKDAALVFDDADLDLAAEEIVEGAFSYAGQRCTAIKRVLAHRDICNELTKKIIEQVKEKYGIVGDPRLIETQMGPVISLRQAEYIEAMVKEAIGEGAKILLGGARRGNYIDAVVLGEVTTKMRIAWEEQFAPVLPIISCKDEEEMISLHNQSQYGLGASIFTEDKAKAYEVALRLEAGVVQINAKSERFPDSFPFLGVKDSGLGTQGIRWSIEAMTRIKSVVENKS